MEGLAHTLMCITVMHRNYLTQGCYVNSFELCDSSSGIFTHLLSRIQVVLVNEFRKMMLIPT